MMMIAAGRQITSVFSESSCPVFWCAVGQWMDGWMSNDDDGVGDDDDGD